ncbi:MAG TPA: hypothetical protein VH188_11365 [Chthoniobacterales bacterium]|jgi:hypothetical protein|nr:hypothetical protein [Chthoniobacterales bacterium]
MKSLVVIAAWLMLVAGMVLGEEPVLMWFPNEKPIIELQFPTGYKAAYRKDGTCLAVGPKQVMALVTMDKVKDAAAAKNALPEFAKSFAVRSLAFRDLKTGSVEDAKLPRPQESAEAIGTKLLTTSGINSDGDETFLTVTAFPWNHRYFVLFALSQPADKEQLEKDRRLVLESVSDVNDD